MIFVGRILTITAVLLIFVAYSLFIPTSLSTPLIADYIKNHFVREIIFGLTLAILAIYSVIRAKSPSDLRQTALLGSLVVLPFWVAWAFGWSTGGIEDVWGDKVTSNGAYTLHIPQVLLFYSGLVTMFVCLRNESTDSQ